MIPAIHEDPLTPELLRRFQKDLLRWYQRNQRPLPWRGSRDPYRILVSEILLQQTRASTAAAYYERFLERFPTLPVLARSSLESVLEVWQGLGYYSRARNLHLTARRITADHGGRIPSDPEVLQSLPGIGPYTAAAVASIAFNRDAAVVDGNVLRVLSRVFACRLDPRLPAVRQSLQLLADRLLPAGKASQFNQALMELGALICTPRKPVCRLCALAGVCASLRTGEVQSIPAHTPRPPLPCRNRIVAVVQSETGKMLLFTRRPPSGLLGGLWELPGLDQSGAADGFESARRRLERRLRRHARLRRAECHQLGALRHTYSHFHEDHTILQYSGGPKLGTREYAGRLRGRSASQAEQKVCWQYPNKLNGMPITGATRKILKLIELKERA